MPSSLADRALAASALLLLVACAAPLARAKHDFRRGDLERAKTELEALEPQRPTMPLQGQAEYALYRGLVHLGLGDRDGAKRWLDDAKAIEDAHPQTLVKDDFARLRLAEESLGSPAPSVP